MYKRWIVFIHAVLVGNEQLLAAPASMKTLPIGVTGMEAPSATQINLQITNRTAWQAAPPHKLTPINGHMAVPYVITHHTAIPAACNSTATCKDVLKSMQRTHQVDRGWDDIGYNFLIGGSTNAFTEVYEGRGFGVSGAHSGAAYNSQSVGICLIGDWSEAEPPISMLEKLQQLITYGIQAGYIQKNYKLIGHRQVRATVCPGNKLFNIIKGWEHFAQRLN